MQKKLENKGEIEAMDLLITWDKEKLFFKLESTINPRITLLEINGDRNRLKSKLNHYRHNFLSHCLYHFEYHLEIKEEDILAEFDKLEDYGPFENVKEYSKKFHQLYLEMNQFDPVQKPKKVNIWETFIPNSDMVYCYRILCLLLDEKCLI